MKKVGYVTIIGRPNVGKSTFINALLEEKVSITSNTPQTTRKKILAIFNDEESQIIFFDTPGVHKTNKVFGEKINNEAIGSLCEADLILYFIDSSRQGGEEEKYLKDILNNYKKPVLKVYTKIDRETKIDIPKNSIKISSTKKEGFKELIDNIKKHLPDGELLYPEDYYTHQDIYFRIEEIIREKLFINTKEELPHASYIKVEDMEEKTNKTPGVNLLKINAYIFTETDSQKYIIIGKQGKLITKIGKEARIELENIFEKKIFLNLRVKVMKKWRKNEKLVKGMFR